jgi:hypothetical protein
MSSEARLTSPQAIDRRLREDGLEEDGDELVEETPGCGSGQAAAAKRGESSNSSMSGSSRRMMRR